MEIGKINSTSFALPKKEDTVHEIKEHLMKKQAPEEIIAEREQLTVEQLRGLTSDANDFFKMTETNLQFQLHEGLDEYYVSVIDAKTEEVIRQIPSEKMLDMYAAMRDLVGLMVDRKV